MASSSSAPQLQLLSPSSCCSSSVSSATSNSTAGTNTIYFRRKGSAVFSPRSTGPKRRSLSASAISKVRTPNDKANERFLQSTDKRRRYMRRGSKTSCMLRGSFRVELPSLSLDDSTHSTTSNGTMISASNNSVLSATTMNSQHSRCDSFASPKPFENSAFRKMSIQEYRARLQQGPGGITASPLALDSPARSCKNRKEATVCLLSSALALASIQDAAKSQHVDDCDGPIL